MHWQGHQITGKMSNISLGGAWIDQVSALPPKGDSVTVEVRAESEKPLVEGTVSSRVVHSVWIGELGSFGVQFNEPVEQIRSKLAFIFEDERET